MRRTFSIRHLAHRLKSRPPEYAVELERCIVERTPSGIVVDTACDAYRAMKRKYSPARTVERHEHDGRLAILRQICFACEDKCDFGRLGSCKQRPLLEQGQMCAKGKW